MKRSIIACALLVALGAAGQSAPHKGTLETFSYQGPDTVKEAMVYLPFGYYDEGNTQRYNVVYLIHGGGDGITSFFNDPRSPLQLTDVLDHLIADGIMEPVIVVTPTFYNGLKRPTKENGGMMDARNQTRIFHKELAENLIPSLESHYRTHYSDGDVAASRDHRAFGGFSMGALTAWYQLAYAPEAARHYIPLSGDLWVYDSDGQKLSATIAARWLEDKLRAGEYADAVRVYAASGTDDIAGPAEQALVEALMQGDVFNSANLSLSMKPGGVHYYGDINEYLFNILPKIWTK